MKKIYNYQVVTTGYRSNEVEISSDDLQALKEWKEHPYTGATDEELVKYIAGLSEYMYDEMMDMSGEKETNIPEFAKNLYSQLFGDGVERTELWNSLNKSGESELKLEDNEGNELGSAASLM